MTPINTAMSPGSCWRFSRHSLSVLVNHAGFRASQPESVAGRRHQRCGNTRHVIVVGQMESVDLGRWIHGGPSPGWYLGGPASIPWRVGRWAQDPEMEGKYLRVILLSDGEAVHNAF